ncbi:MAG: helix-hairpin-helix domain-containing protein [Chitinivibrionales bacterium]|nr:helix-hairpin-helix domain-containing protein [Chitinivibrionales bacterium]
MDIISQLINECNLQKSQIENAIALFNEGATIPFIARYRKERTGSMDEIELRDVQHKYTYYTELEERRKTILESIASQNKLTPALQKKIEDTVSKVELEDLYLPYRPKRVTRGKKAQDAGLEPLARWLVDCQSKSASIEQEAVRFCTAEAAEKGFDTTEKIIAGACDILAEELSDNADIRRWLRELASHKGLVIAKVKKEFAEQKTKFSMYYDYKEPVKDAPSHRVLAILRGEREKVLTMTVDFSAEEALHYLCSQLIKHPDSITAELLRKTAQDSLNRLLSTATETEIRKELRERAELEAFKVFGENLRTVLMAPPAGRKAVLGVDPGFRTGCKIVAIDNTGKFMENTTVYPTEPQNDIETAAIELLRLIKKYGIQLIAIGNGTASREAEKFIRETLKDIPTELRPICVVVSEAGASVYSASELAAKEFPDFDVTVRGAISIARRLQDPLSELVKIDAKSIGVGQYQHDVNQSILKDSLEEIVESCVNQVGVDINLASAELLRYVSGLNQKVAANIVDFRNEHGAFESREDVKKVSGIGEKTFEQAAGFLRIPHSQNPLDNSAVHPERYDFVFRMAKELAATVEELIGNTAVLKKIEKKKFVSEQIGLPTIDDIILELEKPGRDPREQFRYAEFSDAIRELSDLKPGMKLEGTVTNVTNFGAFVDIGVHQDGLVHISELSDTFVSDPTKVVKVGQIVQVTVMDVDTELKRIALSLKSQPGSKPVKEKTHHPKQEQQHHQQPTQKQKEKKTNREAAPKKEMSVAEKLQQWTQKNSEPKKLVTAKPKFNIRQIMK